MPVRSPNLPPRAMSLADFTDASLWQPVVPGNRTLGRMAGHITSSIS